MALFILFLFAIGALFVLFTFLGGFFTVATAEMAVVQRLGKFVRIAGPGLNFKMPWLERVAGRVNMRVQQFRVEVETKTKDNVFVKVLVSVQYQVLQDKVFEAFYKLQSPGDQITSYVFDSVRSQVPKLLLDETFEQKDNVANSVKTELSGVMQDYGYAIIKALVTDINPDDKVKSAMNDINAAQREQVAAQARGEADKILKVKQAEAEAESKALQGQGIANQRKAIISGLRESVETFKQSVEGATAQDVMALVLMTQYFDTLKEIGAQTRSNTILMPHSPGALPDFFSQIQNAIMVGARAESESSAAAGGGK
ncbi:MAG TPA: SPFH domain-containing protein [Terriglobales bacterium]|nr:SPFH domain-containing protein [Terriglobales bacterium]